MPRSKHTRWIFLRGFTREARHWAHFIENFQMHHQDSDIVTLDLPGAGLFYQEKAPLKISENTDFLQRLAENRQLFDRPTHLLAISLGGMIALNWLNRYPMNFQSAVLINSSASGISPFYRRLNWKNYPTFFRTAAQRDRLERERWILKMVSQRKEQHEELAHKFVSYYQDRPMSQANIARQLVAAGRFRAPYEYKGPPMLLINSLGDVLVDPRCTVDMHSKWSRPSREASPSPALELVTHPWAGHDLPLDDPEWVSTTVKNWHNFHF